jgi:hypothetical protein
MEIMPGKKNREQVGIGESGSFGFRDRENSETL